MEIEKTQSEGVTVLTLSGRLDTITSPKLQRILTEEIKRSDKVELDFNGVAYVSSAGVRVLLSGEKSSKASGKTMTLVNVSPEVMKILDITGIAETLNIS